MKATAIAPANIAFIKYWGKADEKLRLPLNDSISMNLSGAYTVTTVEFSKIYQKDQVAFRGGEFSEQEIARVVKGLNRMRQRAGRSEYAKVATKNTFPKGTGAAASASGFAALTIAGFAALDMALSEKELTIFARQGSGSACRSIPDGFVVWEKGYSSDTSYAYSLYHPEYWDIRDILVIVDRQMKKVSTTEGQEGIKTSPLWRARIERVPERIEKTKKALAEKNISHLGEIIEEDCLDMHFVMQTQNPPLFYWNDITKEIMDAVCVWRKEEIPVYFTIDAGSNVHLICETKHESAVVLKLKEMKGIQEIIINKPSRGARLVEDHLF